MARPSNTDQRRTQIAEGLLSVMAEHGYDGASVQSIAQAAGLTPGLVHYHFESKQQILLALIELLATRLRQRYERRLKRASSARERLDALLDAYVALGSDAHPAAVACWVAIGAEAVRRPEVRAAYRAALRSDLEQLDLHVQAVLAAEQRSTREARAIAAALMASVLGCYQLSVAAEATPRGFAASALRRMADGLIAAQPKEQP